MSQSLLDTVRFLQPADFRCRMSDVGCWMPDFSIGCQMSDVGSRKSDVNSTDAKCLFEMGVITLPLNQSF